MKFVNVKNLMVFLIVVLFISTYLVSFAKEINLGIRDNPQIENVKNPNLETEIMSRCSQKYYANENEESEISNYIIFFFFLSYFYTNYF